jgi:hypothetical protein
LSIFIFFRIAIVNVVVGILIFPFVRLSSGLCHTYQSQVILLHLMFQYRDLAVVSGVVSCCVALNAAALMSCLLPFNERALVLLPLCWLTENECECEGE